MFFYAGKYFTSAVTVAKLIDVTCEKCDCAYRYQLVRRGKGAASAPYYIGMESGRRRAQANACQDAAKKLERGIEPVACPDCGWVQSNMVAEMRRRAGRWLIPVGVISLVVTAAITFIATIVATEAFHRPLLKMDGQHAVAILSIAIIGCAAGLSAFAARAWWVSQVNPNRAYPARGDAIPGAPVAMKLATASFEALHTAERSAPAAVDIPATAPALAYERRAPEVAAGGWATVQLLNMSLPRLCMCCMGPADQVVARPYRVGRPLVQVPLLLCPACRSQMSKRNGLLVFAGAFIGLVLAAYFWRHTPKDPGPFIAVVLGMIFAGLGGLAGAFCSWSLFRPPVRYRGFSEERNTVEVKFRNPAYVDEFLAANRRAAERAVRVGGPAPSTPRVMNAA